MCLWIVREGILASTNFHGGRDAEIRNRAKRAIVVKKNKVSVLHCML
jgi:hypothetical protein